MEKKPEITESTATQFVLVRDKAGNEFICKVGDLKDPSAVSEEEKRKCIENVREYWDSV
ncbi:MAG: hypothetical protein JW883_04070 [Deltaproteobacteria bacterium]|jgi:hypothetical protein|nr:hypothetical protein [Deltaproteobacteria bacterium]